MKEILIYDGSNITDRTDEDFIIEDILGLITTPLFVVFDELYSELTVGRWDGPAVMEPGIISRSNTLMSMILQYDIFEIGYEDGALIIHGHHHDGTNVHRIRGYVNGRPADIPEDIFTYLQ